MLPEGALFSADDPGDGPDNGDAGRALAWADLCARFAASRDMRRSMHADRATAADRDQPVRAHVRVHDGGAAGEPDFNLGGLAICKAGGAKDGTAIIGTRGRQ
jgi:hypothetical protein